LRIAERAAFPQRHDSCYRECVKEDSLKVGDVIEVTTERLAYGGDAIARHNGLAVFIPFAAPAERLRVRIVERKRNYARASIEEVIAPSASRRAAPCQHFGDCGGCQLQHLTYEAQLEAKAGFVRDALERVGKIDWPREIEVRHASEFGYRSRAQVKVEPCGQQKHPRRSVGFNRTGLHSVCDVSVCPVLTPELQAALESLRSFVGNSPQSDLSEVEMAAGDNGVAVEPRLPGLLPGPVEINARGSVYRFSPSTFFQVNALLLETLISEAVGESSGELAIDLYAGVGLFTVGLARRFEKVIGVESDPGAADFARKNISANNLANVRFYNARAEHWIREFAGRQKAKQSPPPELVLLDPPRAGAAESVIPIAELKPRRISYVSCDPPTLARDLRRLLDSGFELERVTAIDLFPQTYHVETVATLNRR
jgi:23S rRNA (uracil1939-C5)-methyltransferase